MKSLLKIFLLCGFLITVSSCATTRDVAMPDDKVKISILGGINHGGVTENTDMSELAELNNEVDAFTGATHPGINVGLHTQKYLRKNQIETGIDFMYSSQTFSYNDNENNYHGTRKIHLSQLMLPVTYNILLFRNQFPEAAIQLKTGYVAQLNFLYTSDRGNIPAYSVRQWSHGLTVGIAAYPVQFENGGKLGFYFDAYRGSQIYEDYYNQSSFDMPGTSFIKFGVKYQFK